MPFSGAQMNLDRRPVNEEPSAARQSEAAAAVRFLAVNSLRPGCSAPAAGPGAGEAARMGRANTPSIFSPGTEEGWLGPADVFFLSAALLRSPPSAADVARSRRRGVMNCVVCAL